MSVRFKYIMEPIYQRHYHLVGVAGVGMSALAQVLLARGYAVSGSDRFLDEGKALDVMLKLRSAGLQLVLQDGSGVKPETTGVITSTAIEQDNPDVIAALRQGVSVMHRTDMLAYLAAGQRLIAITGTSGKTTVTGMVGWIFECLGKDPTVVNGGAVINWMSDYRIGNVRIGHSHTWIVEADESDRSLLRFDPDWAVVTNISKDHFELDEVTDLFRSFAGRVRSGVVCGAGVSVTLRKGSEATSKPAAFFVEERFEPYEEAGYFHFWYKGLAFQSPLIGRHNAENAFIAVVLCDQLGMDRTAVRNALISFKGIQRRLEKVGIARGVSIIDDYAHNPAKIRGSWKAVSPMHRRLVGVWRPHGFAPMANMINELAAAFAEVCRPEDKLFVLPVYYAGGSAKKKVASEDLVSLLKERQVNVELVPDYDHLLVQLPREVHEGDGVLCMGARDPQIPLFARQLLRNLSAT